MKSNAKLIRPLVANLEAYIPGEQPSIPGLVKLNTNENPYPPSPKVLKHVAAAVDGRLRLYPNPTAQPLREELAKYHGCEPAQIIVGNGSDELLALAVRSFTEPADSSGERQSRSTVQIFHPSYSLYPVLAATHGASVNAVALGDEFGLPTVKELRKGGQWDFNAALTLITTPNAPSGRGYSTDELDALCSAQKGVVILDEAYVDFADENAAALALRHPHVIVSRTFSKAYSLCFQRVGYFIAHPALIAALDKMRDSYNVNGLGQIAALATLKDLPYYQRNFTKIVDTRESVIVQLTLLGFEVRPSQTNFILAKPPGPPAREWLELLRAKKVLVRWFCAPEVADSLRITIGTEEEMDKLLAAVLSILNKK